ncbi:hypothetical protein [Pueribacillus theae]|nr:hypothetical protein [Pueribacillus theae]
MYSEPDMTNVEEMSTIDSSDFLLMTTGVMIISAITYLFSLLIS